MANMIDATLKIVAVVGCVVYILVILVSARSPAQPSGMSSPTEVYVDCSNFEITRMYDDSIIVRIKPKEGE